MALNSAVGSVKSRVGGSLSLPEFPVPLEVPDLAEAGPFAATELPGGAAAFQHRRDVVVAATRVPTWRVRCAAFASPQLPKGVPLAPTKFPHAVRDVVVAATRVP